MSALPRIDKLEIQSTLGRGAMGIVYKAHDPFMDRIVAVKMLRTDVLDSDERDDFLRRFRGEAKAYGRLLHPNIVTCYSYNEADGQSYIVMEYVEGKSLKEHLDRGTRFGLLQVREIMLQLLGALAYSHVHGVIHRDIKPANVLLTTDGRIKVTDFGIARVEAAAATSHTKHVVGSPSYMSPEQFSGKTVDTRTDIYSAGLVFYELLTGERPFPNTDLGTALYNVLYSEPEPPSRRNAQVTAQIDNVVLKSLQKDPAQRYATAAAFFDDVERSLTPRASNDDLEAAHSSGDETQVINEQHAFDTMRLTQHRKIAALQESAVESLHTRRATGGAPAAVMEIPLSDENPPTALPPSAGYVPSSTPIAQSSVAAGKRRTMVGAALAVTSVAAGLMWMASSDRGRMFDSRVQEQAKEDVAIGDTSPRVDSTGLIDPSSGNPAAQTNDHIATSNAAKQSNPTPTSGQASIDAAAESGLPADFAPDQQAISAALQDLPCAYVTAATRGSDVMLSGFVASQEDVATAQRAVANIAGVQRVTADLSVVARPYCELLGMLHPLRGTAPGAPILPDASQVVRFREGDTLALDLKAPPYDAYMYVDYFLLDGQVVHLLPNDLQKDNRLTAGLRSRIGEPGPGKRHWEVSPPFGREMITIVASREPLVLGERPEVESAQDYLPVLQLALSNAGDKQLTANYTFIETRARHAE